MAKLRPNQFTLPSGSVITEIPILYSTPMVQANLEDRKNETRRTRGFTNENPDQWELCWVGDTLNDQHAPNIIGLMCFGAMFQHKIYPKKLAFVKSPYGKPGDLLWVKETWCQPVRGDQEEGFTCFKADWHEGITSHPKNKGIWKPSIHMPKSASRIWAMVEDIRVERVQDISEEDAKAEGIEIIHWAEPTVPVYRNYLLKEKLGSVNPIKSFQSLWISINSQASWESNPWVWVIKYRTLSKTGRPSMETIAEAHDDIVNRNSQLANQNV